MAILKEKALTNIEDGFVKLRHIQSNYSNKDILKEGNDKYYLITFLNYFSIRGQANIDKKISTFLEFFTLVDWNKKDKLTYFYHHYHFYFDFFDLAGNDEISKKYSIKDFFENNIYLSLEEKDLEGLCITATKDLSIDEFWKYFYEGYITDIFEGIYYTYYDTILTKDIYEEEKRVIINTLSYLYNVIGDVFEIDEAMFNKKQKVPFINFLMSYYYIGFIDIEGVSFEKGKISFTIKVLPKLGYILDELEEKRALILDRVFDETYKELKVKKKNGKPHLLEGKLEYEGDENKFVELRKKFPNSEINTKNYKGKTQKYEVTEKVRFDNKTE